jgi:endonuclease YncB( thermonuclease family)
MINFGRIFNQRRFNMLKRPLILIIITILLAIATLAHAQPITGKVISISDGDTVTVLRQQGRLTYGVAAKTLNFYQQ